MHDRVGDIWEPLLILADLAGGDWPNLARQSAGHKAVMETNTAWAGEIRRTRHIGDFRDWKNHDAYAKAFDRLLRDLKPGGAKV